MGALQVVTGIGEMAGAVMMTAGSDGLLIGPGYFTGLNAADNIVKGLAQIGLGKEIDTQTIKLLTTTGISRQNTMVIDAGFSLSGGLVKASSFVASSAGIFKGEKMAAGSYARAKGYPLKSSIDWIRNGQNSTAVSMAGNGMLSGANGLFGSFASGSDFVQTIANTGVGVIIGAGARKVPNTPQNCAVISGFSNIAAQKITEIYDPSTYSFNYGSLGGSILGGGVYGHLTRHAGPISGVIIGSPVEAGFESVGYALGERRKHR